MQEDLFDIFQKLSEVIVVCNSCHHSKEIKLDVDTESTDLHCQIISFVDNDIIITTFSWRMDLIVHC